MSRCSRRPTVRQLEERLREASRRIDDLDRFSRWTGGIIENMTICLSLTPEKEELAKVTEEYHRLYPSVSGGTEF